MKLEIDDFQEFFLERIKHQYKINPEFIVFCQTLIETFYRFQVDIDILNEKWNFKSDILEVLLELCEILGVNAKTKDIKELQALVTKFGFLKNGSGTINDIIFVIRNYANANSIIAKSVNPARIFIIVDNLTELDKIKDISDFAAGGVTIDIKVSDGGTQVFPDGGDQNTAQLLIRGDQEGYLQLTDGNMILTNNFETYDL